VVSDLGWWAEIAVLAGDCAFPDEVAYGDTGPDAATPLLPVTRLLGPAEYRLVVGGGEPAFFGTFRLALVFAAP